MTQNDEHATELEFTFVRPMIFNHSPRSIGERACTPSLWHFGREAGSDSRSPDQAFPLLAELPLSPGLSPFLWTHLSPDMENEGRRDHSPSSLRDGEAANRLLAVEDIEPALEMPSIGEAVASQDMEGADASPVSVAKRLEDSPEGGRQKHQPLVLHLDRGTGTGDDAAVLDWSSDSSLTVSDNLTRIPCRLASGDVNYRRRQGLDVPFWLQGFKPHREQRRSWIDQTKAVCKASGTQSSAPEECEEECGRHNYSEKCFHPVA